MGRILLTLILFLAVISCSNNGGKTPQKQPITNLSLDQLDSIGKAFKMESGTYGGTLRLTLANDPNGLCPATSTSAYSSDVLGYIYEGLITSDPNTLDDKPYIAKSWEISPDGLTWTFHLRNDVSFSNGTRLSAYDVTFTFNDVIYNKKINASVRDNFMINGRQIAVSAPDSFTVVFTLPAPFAPFLTVVGMPIMPRGVYAKHAADGTLEAFMSNGAKPEDIVGSGPFLLEKIELGQRVILKRNPGYWRADSSGNKLPYLDQVVLTVVREPNIAVLKFQQGEVDEVLVPGDQYQMLKPQEKEKNFSIYRVGPSWYDPFFVFNQNNQTNPKTGKPYLDPKKQKWFQNRNFRRACAYAVNYKTIIDVAYNGLAHPPQGIWGAHKGFFSNTAAPSYSYSPDSARAILAAEGFKDINNDSILEDADGNPVEFTIMTSATDLTRRVYEMVRKDLQNIGFKAHLNLVEFNTMLERIDGTYDWDVTAYSLGGIRDPHFAKSTEVYSSERYVINPRRKTPTHPWEKRIEEIFELGVGEMDREKRKALYGEWQQIVQDQCTHVYMPLREIIVGVQNRFGNVHLTRNLALGMRVLYNVEEIYIKDNTKK